MQEVDEALTQTVEIAVVGAEVVVVDVGDDGDERLQMEERRVALVGLRNEITARTETRIGARTLQATADDEGRILATLGEHGRDEACSRGLAVRAGHRDCRAKPHQLAKHFGTRYDRDAQLQSADELRVFA